MGFHICVFSYDISNNHLVRQHLDIDCNGIISCLCVFSNVSPDCYLQRMSLDTDCKTVVSHLHVFYVYLQTAFYWKKYFDIACKALVHLLKEYGFSPVCVLKWLSWEKPFGQWLQGYSFLPTKILVGLFRNKMGHCYGY